jgi:hypothetical protein
MSFSVENLFDYKVELINFFRELIWRYVKLPLFGEMIITTLLSAKASRCSQTCYLAVDVVICPRCVPNIRCSVLILLVWYFPNIFRPFKYTLTHNIFL